MVQRTRKSVFFISVILSICLLMGIVVLGVDLFCFNTDFYMKEYEKLGTGRYLKMSDEDLAKVTETLFDYLRDNRDDIDVMVSVGGETKLFYNEREYLHMIDVRNLYHSAKTVGYGGIILSIAFFAYILICKRSEQLDNVLKGYIRGNIIFFAVITVLVVLALIDFDFFWNNFHRVFFTNDLWMLDPATDNMINIFDEVVFYDIVLKVAFFAMGLIAVLFGASTVILNKRRKALLENESRRTVKE